MKSLPLILALAALVTACVGSGSYSEFTTLPENGWAYGDTLEFFPDMSDSIAEGHIKVAVVHLPTYPWSDLWLEVSYGNDTAIYRDTIGLQLADRYGHWEGSNVGTTYQYETTLPDRVRLHRGARVAVRHIMRVDTLHGIDKIGLSLSE